jgi:hypothetical protein
MNTNSIENVEKEFYDILSILYQQNPNFSYRTINIKIKNRIVLLEQWIEDIDKLNSKHFLIMIDSIGCINNLQKISRTMTIKNKITQLINIYENSFNKKFNLAKILINKIHQ